MSATSGFTITEPGTYQARNAETWRVICLDGNNAEYPVVALDSRGNPNTFTKSGMLRVGQQSEFDLVGIAGRDGAAFVTGTLEVRIKGSFTDMSDIELKSHVAMLAQIQREIYAEQRRRLPAVDETNNQENL